MLKRQTRSRAESIRERGGLIAAILSLPYIDPDQGAIVAQVSDTPRLPERQGGGRESQRRQVVAD